MTGQPGDAPTSGNEIPGTCPAAESRHTRPPALLVTQYRRGGTAVVAGRRAGEVVEVALGPRRPIGGAYSVTTRDVPQVVAAAKALGGTVILEEVG